ncbi:MAG: dolichyl-phosphate-mannose--protein mannosyltransferase, partial [Alistipes sp.]|nr:dolichyl-phosphate-mannose--protein mannosyltransferase [Alistipes sp.]
MLKNRLRALPLLLFALLLPAMALRDFTPSNELRYLSIADEALADGNFFAFTNQGAPYADKPP